MDRICEPVTVSGLQIVPGDILLADDSGAVVIPLAMVETVLKTAQEIAQAEERIVQLVRAGCTLKEAREKTGYHRLQTKDR